MIFDYQGKKFIDNGQFDRLVISGIRVANTPEIAFGGVMAENDPPEATMFTIKNPEVYIKNNRLQFSCSQNMDNVNLKDITRFFIDCPTDNVGATNDVFPKCIKTDIQRAIDVMAEEFGLLQFVTFKPKNFNDRLLLYMYPVLRELCTYDTNFRKLFNEIAQHWSSTNDCTYNICEALCVNSIKDSIKISCGTYSKAIMKWFGYGLIEDLNIEDKYSFLDPNMVNNMLGVDISNFSLKYKNVLLPDKLKILCFYGDLFNSNTDFISQALQENISPLPVSKKVTNFLKSNFSEKKILRLLRENSEFNQHPGYLTDITEQYNKYCNPDSIPPKLRSKYLNGLEIPKFQTLKELHDKISRDYNEIKTEEANRPFEFTEEEWKLHGYKIGNVEIVLPSEASVVVDWGKQLKHCIASYTEGMARKDYLLLGVKVNGKLLYTLQVYTTNLTDANNPEQKRYKITQFYGYRNAKPEAKEDTSIRETVQQILDDVFNINLQGKSLKEVNCG